jgi:hypothetical protein
MISQRRTVTRTKRVWQDAPNQPKAEQEAFAETVFDYYFCGDDTTAVGLTSSCLTASDPYSAEARTTVELYLPDEKVLAAIVEYVAKLRRNVERSMRNVERSMRNGADGLTVHCGVADCERLQRIAGAMGLAYTAPHSQEAAQ